MIKLNDKTLQLIRDDKQLFIKIQIALAVSEKTMYDYINNNSPNLTKLDSLTTIIEATSLPLSEITTGGKLSKLLSK